MWDGETDMHMQHDMLYPLRKSQRDAWRQRAETGVAEWVGVAMDDGAEGTTTTSSPASDEAAAPVAAPDADADAGVETEAEMEAEAEAAAEVTATAVVVAINTPSSEELGGLDPVQALAEENEVLRAELARLRGVGGRM